MMISKTTAYGIRALAYLANHPDCLCGLQQIVEQESIPPVYLRKILGMLRRHRFVRSVKGIHGGYELARPAETITLWEIFRVLEPDPYLDSCILGYGTCLHDSTCALHEGWIKLRRDFVGLLQSKTISEVAITTAGKPVDSGTDVKKS